MKKLSMDIIIGSLIISCGIMVHGYLISESRTPIGIASMGSKVDSDVMTLSEASRYLRLTEDEIMNVIKTEEHMLETRHHFTGEMLSYIIINDKYYFDRESLKEWFKDSNEDKRNYDFSNKRIN